METGTFSEWAANDGGGATAQMNWVDDTTGTVHTTVTTEHARRGLYSVKFQIPADKGQTAIAQAQVQRWREPQLEPGTYPELFYSVWFYIPQQYTVAWWLNMFQLHALGNNDRIANAVVLFVNTSTEKMRFHLQLSDQFNNNPGSWDSQIDMPIGKWFLVEMRVRSGTNMDGAVQVWQDGVEIFNVSGVTNNAVGYVYQWYVNAYGQWVSPSPVVLYIDDAVISTARVAQ